MKVRIKLAKRKPPARETEMPLRATVRGKDESTPGPWADLVRFALSALRSERAKRNADEGKTDAA